MGTESHGEDSGRANNDLPRTRKKFEGGRGEALTVCPRPGHDFDEASVISIVKDGGIVDAEHLEGLDMKVIERECNGIASEVIEVMKADLLA